jgi:acyl carrier protein
MEIIQPLKTQINTAFLKQSPECELSDDFPLIESGVLDSMGLVSLLGFLETRFSVHIDGSDLTLENFETPLAIARLVASKDLSRRNV